MSLYPDTNPPANSSDWSSYPATTSILADLNDLTGVGTGNITNLETDSIALRPGTLATAISLTDDLDQIGSSKTIRTEGDVVSSQGGSQPYSLNYIGNIVYGGGGTGPQGPTGATGAQGDTGATGANGVGSFLSGVCIDGGTYIVPPGYININSYGGSLMISSTPAVEAYMTYASTLGNQSWSFVGASGDTFTTPFPIPAPSIYGPDPSGNILWTLAQDPLSLQFIWGLNGGEQYNFFLTAVSPYGATGAQGATGATGAQGATGATGPFSTALANKIEVVSASDVPSTALAWTSLPSAGNEYVPLADSLSLAPIAPSTGTGWRMTKPTSFLATAMISGTAYTVNAVGTTNWTLIGWTAPVVVGSTATYNGVVATGTGTVSLASVYGTNISWFPYNPTYGQTLPWTIPATPIRKKNLNAVWALVRFNNDIAQQGYFSLTVESYAYQTPPATGAFTGRWAYSLPMYAVAGGSAVQFNAGATLTTTQPRAVGGFTYLLYIEDKYPKMLPNISGQFQVSNGMFGSQSQVAKTTRDPYDVYSEYQHYPLNAVLYSENAVQPSYPTAEYTDQGDVEISAIYFKTTQNPNSPQRPQPDFDFQVMAMGYRGTDDAGAVVSQNYTLTY